jgi:hypothetical protein
MDSGVHTLISDQTAWLNNTLYANAPLRNKFAIYHVPIYSSKSATYQGVQQQWQWAPLFDIYNVTAAFEHHHHLYKRTYKIFENQISTTDRGTYYFGDGQLGIEDGTPTSYFSKSPLLADVKDIPNIWFVTASGKSAKAMPYGYSNQKIIPLTDSEILM